nr:MAG TPA: hypothetical protein [Bacteriophage sp.]
MFPCLVTYREYLTNNLEHDRIINGNGSTMLTDYPSVFHVSCTFAGCCESAEV